MLAAITKIRISASHDAETLHRAFATHRRIQIRNFLDLPSADAVAAAVTNQKRWNLVYMDGAKHIDSDANAVASWPTSQRQRLMKHVYRQATNRFQYIYATVPIYDIYHQNQLPGHFFNTIFEFLNGEEFLRLVRRVTGEQSIAFADAQATRFDPGHFLTCHDDSVENKNRLVAYVLNLTQMWRPDWGGCLQFFNSEGNIEEAYTPAFNTLNLFGVPADHSVSIVAPFAGASRYSITGWLRAGRDPRA